jgi:Ca2+-binding RTX toxin-like protein
VAGRNPIISLKCLSQGRPYRWTGRATPASRPRAEASHDPSDPRLRLDLLEPRAVPAATLDPATGKVTIEPDTESWPVVGEVVVLDTVPGAVRVLQNGILYDFPEADVRLIEMYWFGPRDTTVYVERTLSSTTVSINLLGGTRTAVHLAAGTRDLDNVAGPVGVWTAELLTLNDQDHGAAAGYRVTGYGIIATGGRAFGDLSFEMFSSPDIFLNVADAGSTVHMDEEHYLPRLRVVGGAAADVVNLRTGAIGFRPQHLRVTGNGGADAIHIVDEPLADQIDSTTVFDITPATVSWDGTVGLTYGSVETLTVTAKDLYADAVWDQTFTLDGVFTSTAVTVDGAGGMDTLRTPNTSNTWNLTGHADSRVGGVTFRNFERLEGGSLGDAFRFVGGTAAWASVDGKGGADALDYSLLGGGVTADLGAGTAFRAGAVTGIENVTGTPFADTLRGDGGTNVLIGVGGADTLDGRSGPDIVDGGDGNDTLVGGPGNDLVRAGAGNDSVTAGTGDDTAYGDTGNDRLDGGDGNDALFGQAGKDALAGADGRDLLFGGTDADGLDGGAGDDVVASGSLVGDILLSRVDALRAEWASGHTYADRVANLRRDSANSTTWATRRNGNYFLTTVGPAPTVLLGPAAQDGLTGGPPESGDPNQDWFFGLSAEFLDRQADEEANG